MIKISVKPLSVNEAWRGRRFKTSAYNNYTRTCFYLLPKIKIPDPPYSVYFEFGFSTKASDFDNPIKPFCDIIQLKYKINDKDIYEARIVKKIVSKGNEYIIFNIDTL